MKKILMLCFAVGAVLMLAGCGGPKGVVKDWKKAIKKGDKAAANKVSVSDLHKSNEMCIKMVGDGKASMKYFDTLTPVDVIKVKEGDKEKTYVLCTIRKEKKAKLKKVDEKWVVEAMGMPVEE